MPHKLEGLLTGRPATDLVGLVAGVRSPLVWSPCLSHHVHVLGVAVPLSATGCAHFTSGSPTSVVTHAEVAQLTADTVRSTASCVPASLPPWVEETPYARRFAGPLCIF